MPAFVGYTEAASYQQVSLVNKPRAVDSLVEFEELYGRGLVTTVTGLTLDSEAPLASRDWEGLASALADYLVEGFGGSIGPKTELRAARFVSSLSLKFGSTQDASAPSYF